MANFFNKKVSDLTFEDIESLKTLGIRESEFIDYKEKLPNNDKIAALVTAFANTYGGWIVFGVREDDDAKPEAIVGVDGTGDDLIGGITQLCYDRIHPAVMCNATTIVIPGSERKVLVVRVLESDLCHAVDGTGHYVKIKATKKPVEREDFFEKADTGRIAWLLNRRLKSLELRSELVAQARRRADALGGGMGADASEYSLELILLPRFPYTSRLMLDDLDLLWRRTCSEICDYYYDYIAYGHPRQWDQSVAKYYETPPDLRGSMSARRYLEIGTHGQVLHRCWMSKQNNGEHDLVIFDEVLSSLLVTLLQSKMVLDECGFAGDVDVECSIAGINNTELICEWPSRSDWHTQKCAESTIANVSGFYRSKPYGQLVRDFTIEFLSRLLFVYGMSRNISNLVEQELLNKLKHNKLALLR